MINLTNNDRLFIEDALRKHSTGFQIGRRYLLILGVADGNSAAACGKILRLDPTKAQRWVQRYNQYGLGRLLAVNHKPKPLKKLKEQYGYWTVLEQIGPRAKVKCRCGKIRWIRSYTLRKGTSTRCRNCVRFGVGVTAAQEYLDAGCPRGMLTKLAKKYGVTKQAVSFAAMRIKLPR